MHNGAEDRCFYVTDVFAVPKCQVYTGLAYVRPAACFTCQFVYAAFVVDQYVITLLTNYIHCIFIISY